MQRLKKRGILAPSPCAFIKSTGTYLTLPYKIQGRESSVGIETGCGLDGPGIESRWDEIFRTLTDRPWDSLSTCTVGTGSFPGLKRPERSADTHPLLAPRSRKSRAIPLPSLWAFRFVRGTFFVGYRSVNSKRSHQCNSSICSVCNIEAFHVRFDIQLISPYLKRKAAFAYSLLPSLFCICHACPSMHCTRQVLQPSVERR
jgi:hypothetical protein